MREVNRRLVGILLVATIGIAAVGLAGLAQSYEDLIVAGAGTASVNGVYKFLSMTNGKPTYYNYAASMNDRAYVTWQNTYWDIFIMSDGVVYTNDADTPTPPASGWVTTAFGYAPAPGVSGGEEITGPDITVSAISGPTTEAGGTATFTLTPDPAPTADVTVPLTSSDPGEGAVPASVVLPSGSTSAVTVTVTGVDDAIIDGNIAYTIETGDPTSSDADYEALGADDVDDVSVTNNDDDVASVTVTSTSGLTTTEAGGTATFTVVLDVEPSSTVTIGVASDDASEGTAAPATLTFTTGDWDTPQTVTVTGQDDDIDDGDIAYTIVTAQASGSGYDGVDPDDVSVTNQDDDTAGITVDPTSGLTTTEAGGTDTFTVVLDCEPSATVTIGISSDDATEGTAAPATLTFTTSDWDTPQTVTVTGQDDGDLDGDIGYTIVTAAATGGDYAGINATDVDVTNEDDDQPGITVTAITGNTTEAGGTATFNISADTAPSADVTVSLSSSNISEGTVQTEVVLPSGSTTPVTVTVTGVDDDIDDGDIGYTIVTGDPVSQGDADYEALGANDVDDVSVTNTDDDTQGVTVTPTSGLTTTEAGGTATFTVVLDSEPAAGDCGETAVVMVPIQSDDTTEGTASPSLLIFPLHQWDVPQTVTITGADDDLADGDVAYTIVVQPAISCGYDGVDGADVSVTNQDDDVVGITVDPTSGLITTEAGGIDTFTVVLDCEPSDTVTIGISSDDTTEGTVAPATLTFTAGNWDTPQTVTATGVDDLVDDGDVAYSIITAAAAGGDYSGINAADVQVTNANDDTPGITVSAISGNTREDGTMATFTVVLDCEPVGSVTIDLLSDNLAEGTIDVDSLTFTTGDWNVPQTVTVTGVDDSSVDGDIGFTIVLFPAVSTDGGFSGIDPDDVEVINEDDENTVIVPTGVAGGGAFLDEVLPVVEGEIQPMAGDLPLTAIHAVGDVITGSCQILSAMGTPTCAGHVYVFLYEVDITAGPEATALLARWLADYSWDTHQFRIALDTTGFAPGYYDLCLSFEGGRREVFRIELVPPAE